MDKSKLVYDFSGWATKSNVKCSDGRTIMEKAFAENDGGKVPLVWQHLHDAPENILGHAMLEQREGGVYAYCKFNDTQPAKVAKQLVAHGDIVSLSIYANGLTQKSNLVVHGTIREVSLVVSGSNPGAMIDNLSISHSDGTEESIVEEAIIFNEDDGISLFKSEDKKIIKHEEAPASEKTVQEVFDSMSEEQRTVVYAIIGELVSKEESEMEQSAIEGDDKVMKNNIFDQSTTVKQANPRLTREQFQEILTDAIKMGSFRQSFLAHAGTYGIDNISVLFPDATVVTPTPDMYTRDMAWVSNVLGNTKHSRFSRIKTVQANLTVESARALGYVTGSLKKEEVFALLSRTTTPTTIYKKQKLDRDDIVDITDMDVVAWLKSEMRMMLDEEIARAVLISDGRAPESEDKITETNVRPIWTDDDFFADHLELAVDVTDPSDVIEAIIRNRTVYRGSGSPTMYASPEVVADMLLEKDTTGRRLYRGIQDLAAELMVSSIVEVPLMSNITRQVGEGELEHTVELLAIIVNLRDYTIGADQGGEINFFQDFDIDYNQQKYLLETRISGSLTKPKSAMVIERVVVGD